ncbi:MAG: class B sortase [Lachnospiraceae bacterium]|nr:class B sortase [Lachnospiraceae bacterium]
MISFFDSIEGCVIYMKDISKHFFFKKAREEDDEATIMNEYAEGFDESPDKKTADIVSQHITRAIEEKTGKTEADDEEIRDYEIGGFHFDTYYEYRNAEEDIKRVEIINKNIDIKDPEAAVRLYNMIRDGKITFKSPIGEQFFNHVGDIVAERSVDLLQDKKVVDEAEGRVKSQKRMALFFISLAVIAFAYFAVSEGTDWWQTRKLTKLQAETESKAEKQDKKNSDNNGADKIIISNQTTIKDQGELTVLPEYKEAHDSNPEMVGWISVPDTDINYPVVSKANDNQYYLTHAFDNSEDKNGSIFMDYRCDIVNPTSNTIVYGHHMNSGLMFGTLDKYLNKDKTYLDAHKIINFNTIYEKRQYEIVAVCLSAVKYQDENSYRYYNFVQAKTQKDFDNFKSDVESRNMYGGDVDIKSSDQLLTLSTCNHYIQDGREFIIAKRVD